MDWAIYLTDSANDNISQLWGVSANMPQKTCAQLNLSSCCQTDVQHDGKCAEDSDVSSQKTSVTGRVHELAHLVLTGTTDMSLLTRCTTPQTVAMSFPSNTRVP